MDVLYAAASVGVFAAGLSTWKSWSLEPGA